VMLQQSLSRLNRLNIGNWKMKFTCGHA